MYILLFYDRNGFSRNPNAYGPLTDNADFSYADGRHTPLLMGQTKRLQRHREYAVSFNTTIYIQYGSVMWLTRLIALCLCRRRLLQLSRRWTLLFNVMLGSRGKRNKGRKPFLTANWNPRLIICSIRNLSNDSAFLLKSLSAIIICLCNNKLKLQNDEMEFLFKCIQLTKRKRKKITAVKLKHKTEEVMTETSS